MANELNFVVKNGLTVNGAFTANSTVVNAAAIIATSVNATSVNTATANATTSIVVGANVTVNTSTVFVGNTTVNTTTTAGSTLLANSTGNTSITPGLMILNSGAFRANSTVVNAAAIIASSLNATSVNTATANATTSIVVGSNLLVNTTAFFVNNASVNTNITAGQISISGVTVNSTIYQGTANNANNLNGQAPSYYTSITDRLGYVPVNRAGDTAMTGNYSTNGQIISAGRGENEQKFLQMYNANTRVYFYLNGKESGLYDTETFQSRWRTDTAGDFNVLNRVVACSPQGISGNTGFAMVNKDGRFGRWNWVDVGTYIEAQIDGGMVSIATNPSDISLKKDIEPTTYDATKTINDIEFVSYNWKPTQYTDKDGVTHTIDRGHVECGFVAQQLQTVDPGLVKTLSDGKLMPDMLNLTSVLGLALQNAQKKIEELETRIQNLEAN